MRRERMKIREKGAREGKRSEETKVYREDRNIERDMGERVKKNDMSRDRVRVKKEEENESLLSSPLKQS